MPTAAGMMAACGVGAGERVLVHDVAGRIPVGTNPRDVTLADEIGDRFDARGKLRHLPQPACL